MAMLPFAFSIHNFISSVGADAGFAAIVGLAVLVLLYFAHARETANLREEAALLTQRLQQAEARVMQLTRGQSAPAAAAEAVPAAAMATFAPAFTAAPALGSATRMIAVGVAPEPEPEPERVAEKPLVAPVPAMAIAGVAAAPPKPPPAVSPPVPALPAPATSAGGNGSSHSPLPTPPEPVAAQPPRPTRPAQSSRPVASRPLPPLNPPRRRQRSRVGRNVAIALVALAAVGAAVVLFAVTSVGASKHPRSASTTSSSGTAHGGAAFKPSSVTVAVLNGTAVNQLAHRVAAKLAARGYRTGTIATAANQTETTTVVAYLSGKNDRSDALHVARALGLRSSALAPIDASTQQVACPTSSPCAANVVVTVGSDLAGL